MLHHPSTVACPALDETAAGVVSDTNISSDASPQEELTKKATKWEGSRTRQHSTKLLKYAEQPVTRTLYDLIQKHRSTGRVPADWKDGLIISVNKVKRQKADGNSYHSISLLSVPSNVFAHVHLGRLQPLSFVNDVHTTELGNDSGYCPREILR